MGTTFVTARGTVGKIAMAGVAMAMNQSCYALASEELHPLLVYFYAREIIKSLKHKATGAVFDALVTRDFDTEHIRLLDALQQDRFLALAEPCYREIHRLSCENIHLAAIRDALLPRLMSREWDAVALQR